MTALDKQPSPGLAYYPRDQIAWSTEAIMDATAPRQTLSGNETFNRRARLMMHPSTMHMPLMELLNRADELFNQVAAQCGAQVVGHTFGLTDSYKSPFVRSGYSEPTHPSIPNTYELVAAEVAIIPDARTLTHEHPLYSPIGRTMRDIQEKAIRDSSWCWYDARPEQCVVSPAGIITVVDIDPFVLKY